MIKSTSPSFLINEVLACNIFYKVELIKLTTPKPDHQKQPLSQKVTSIEPVGPNERSRKPARKYKMYRYKIKSLISVWKGSKASGLQWIKLRDIIQWMRLGEEMDIHRRGRWAQITPRTTRPDGQWDSRTTSTELLASLLSLKVRVHDSMIRKRFCRNGIHGRVSRWKPLPTKNNSQTSKRFLRLWQKFNCFKVFCYIWCKSSTMIYQTNSQVLW